MRDLFKNSLFNAGVAFSNAFCGIWLGVSIANGRDINIPLLFIIFGLVMAGLSVIYNKLDR